MYRCTRCASQRENGVKEKDGVTYKKSVKKDTETKQDKSKKIENEEVDCVAFCAIKKEKGREDWTEGIRKYQGINTIEKEKRNKTSTYLILKSKYERKRNAL